MRALSKEFPDVRFLVANYRPAQRDYCESLLRQTAGDLPVELHVNKTSEILELADCCLMVSGSVSLEVLARGVPAVVLYRADWFFGLLAKLLVTCRYMSLPNLVAGRLLMPEYGIIESIFLRHKIEQMTDHFRTWLSDPMAMARVRVPLHELRDTLMKTGATKNVATFVLDQFAVRQRVSRAA